MTQLISDVVFRWIGPRHLNYPPNDRTFCGLPLDGAQEAVYESVRSLPLCENCKRTKKRYEVDRIEPEIDLGATRRGSALAEGGRVREVPGRLFRVAGETDTYTVVIPSDDDLATTCTCMAAKTHPEILCKHASAVYLTLTMEGSK